MKLQSKIIVVLVPLFIGVFATHSMFTYQSAIANARSNLEREAHNIRALLMATRRVYHHQFLESGLTIDDTTVGFLPAHALGLIAKDFPEWTDSDLVFNNVSDRVRNPDNAADEVELVAMEFYRENSDVKERFDLVDGGDGVEEYYHYTQPIWIEGYCLKCHGKREDAPASIQTRYDSGFGYELGDLRGVMSIKIPAKVAHEQAWATFAQGTLVNLAGYIGAFVLIYGLLVRTALKRLKVLEHGAEEIASGNYGWRSGIAGKDEISAVASGFDDMAESIGVREAALRDSETRFQSLIESAPDAMVVADQHGNICIVNTQTERMFGYSREEMIGQEVEMLIPPRSREIHQTHRDAYNRYPTARTMGTGCELVGMRKSGAEFPVEASLNVIETEPGPMVASSIRDITDRVRTEKASMQKQEQLDDLLANVDAIIMEGDPYNFYYVSGPVERILGYAREKWTEHPEGPGGFWAELLHPDDADKPDICRRAIERGEDLTLNYRLIANDGTPIWFHDSVIVETRSGKPVKSRAVLVDITERVEAENEVRRLHDNLAHVARVSTMGEMATGIAHELNQPLAAIASYSVVAKTIADQPGSNPQQLRNILDKLEKQTIRAGDIVRRMRGFVKNSVSALVPSDINHLVQDVIKLIEPDVHRSDVRIAIDLNESSLNAVIDEIHIQQVLVNLIRNATDAMKATTDHERVVTISTSADKNGNVEVAVSDVGRGIAPADVGRIFDAFYSTKQHGMGMGLAISRSIVEVHGGKLWAEPNAAQGTTFRFTLPMERDAESDGNRRE